MQLHDLIQPRERLGAHPFAAERDWRTARSPRVEVRLAADQPITLRDGTVLRVDVYAPARGGPHPVLLSVAAYNKELHTSGLPTGTNEIGLPHYLASHGYVHVVVPRRGTAPSGGEPDGWFSAREHADLDEILTWCGTQPFSTGRVGMIGASYYGTIQLIAAGLGNPYLKAVMPADPDTDLYRHAFYHGGVANTGFLALWAAFNFTSAVRQRRVAPWLRHLLSYVATSRPFRALMDRALTPARIQRIVDRSALDPAFLRHYVAAVFDAKQDGPWYRALAPAVDNITIPMLLATNWSFVSLHGFGAMDAFYRAPSRDKKIFIAPAHDWIMGRPWNDFQDEAIGFFDHQLKGLDNGYAALPAVRYWLQGADEWHTADAWPPAQARPLSLQLDGGGLDNCAEGSLVPQARAGERSWLCIPRGSPVPAQLGRVGETQNLRYALTFARDTDVVGPVHITLVLRSTTIDTYVVTRILDVAPDGAARPLSHGFLLASTRAVREHASTPNEQVHDFTRQVPLLPGEPTTLRFTPTPIANRFRKGHKLVLEIASRKDQHSPGPGFGGRPGLVYFDTEAPPYSCRNTIVEGAPEASRLEIHVLE